MLEFLHNPIIQGALVLGLAFFAARFLYRKDEKVEGRRRMAAELAAKLKGMGSDILADFLIDYSVGDYDGMGVKLLKYKHMTDSDAGLKAEGRKILRAILGGELQSEDGRAHVEKMLTDMGVRLGSRKPAPSPEPVPVLEPVS